MKKHFIFAVLIFTLATISFVSASNAQGGVGTPRGSSSQDFAPNAIYVELFGNGLLYTVNYDRLISPSTGFRVGFEYIGINGGTDADGNSISASLLAIPATFNYFIGSINSRGMMSSSKLELGLGIIFVHAGASYGGISGAGSGVGGTATVGYRLQPSDGGFVFRIGLTPVFVLSDFQIWGGLSLGYSF
jgi:hypothetical protein